MNCINNKIVRMECPQLLLEAGDIDCCNLTSIMLDPLQLVIESSKDFVLAVSCPSANS